ncbi:hypothetical protein B0J13DRAFT_524006 [Dactylonectria estremocensis]|uniref:Clock-controlled protein 6 n=1 Tax=Dactylonectria estremocensis TaxID=1079267 RepID=A0A9P9F033_9HYPO|nr:hypothetical protein B0J13DRAFT_524006 [Dactylonectria estremocensis]
MKFAAATILAAVAGASAASNVSYVTEVVDVYTTYCPAATEITHGGKTYTVTEATTLTITDCPCTITKPVIATSSVICHDCGHSNSTVPAVIPSTTSTGSYATPTGSTPSEVPASGAGKVAALSGAGLAALVGLAAFL